MCMVRTLKTIQELASHIAGNYVVRMDDSIAALRATVCLCLLLLLSTQPNWRTINHQTQAILRLDHMIHEVALTQSEYILRAHSASAQLDASDD